MTRRMISVVLALFMVIGLVPLSTIAVAAKECPTLAYKETVTVTIAEGESYWYQITPDETKTYTIQSGNRTDNVDPFAVLFNAEEYELVREDDAGGNRNFRIVVELTAGETYYLEVYSYNDDDVGSFDVTLDELTPTYLYFSTHSQTCFVGSQFLLEADVDPDEANSTLKWTSSDESIAAVDANGKITFLAGGDVTITAETINGITDSCDFTVVPVDGPIALGEKEIVITEDEATKELVYTFTPTKTGYYRLSSYDIVSAEAEEIDPRVRVYTEDYTEIKYSDDDGGGVNFYADFSMEAGVRYYFALSLYKPEAIGSYTMMFEEIPTATVVSVNGGDRVMTEGDSDEITVTYAPEGCWIEKFTLSSSDESVVSVSGKAIRAVGGGEATVTVTTERGLTTSFDVTVIAALPITLDTTYTLEGAAQDLGACKRYVFTPTQTGRYTIASSNTVGEDAKVSVSVFDEKDSRENDDAESSFTLTYELVAGASYYYDVTLVCADAQSAVEFMLTKESDEDIPTLQLDTDYTVDITNRGDGVYFVFKPTITGDYVFYSVGDNTAIDPKVILYNDAWEWVMYDDDGAEDDMRNFCLQRRFNAGETYYLKYISYNDNDLGSYTMRAELEFTMLGDYSGDGKVNIIDAFQLYRAVSKGGVPEEKIRVADMDESGMINMIDAFRLYQIASGK